MITPITAEDLKKPQHEQPRALRRYPGGIKAWLQGATVRRYRVPGLGEGLKKYKRQETPVRNMLVRENIAKQHDAWYAKKFGAAA